MDGSSMRTPTKFTCSWRVRMIRTTGNWCTFVGQPLHRSNSSSSSLKDGRRPELVRRRYLLKDDYGKNSRMFVSVYPFLCLFVCAPLLVRIYAPCVEALRKTPLAKKYSIAKKYSTVERLFT